MTNYNEIFWDNVNRWQKFRKLRDVDMADRLELASKSYSKMKSARPGVSLKKLGNYIEALEVDPADLLDEWTDEEWERFVASNQ